MKNVFGRAALPRLRMKKYSEGLFMPLEAVQ
jgi:hypothetical protein